MKKSNDFIRKRESEIVEVINTQGNVTTNEIAEAFDMSLSTARKQLANLHDKGLIIRTHGGAMKSEHLSALDNPVTRCFPVTHLDLKLPIAKAARAYIHDNDVIGMCGGTTTYVLATLLKDVKNLTVVTNSILIANELMGNPDIQIRVCGGVVQSTKGSLVGPHAVDFFKNIYLDKAFIGADTISTHFGTASLNAFVSNLERVVLDRANERFVLADHTKFQQSVSVVDLVASNDEIDYIVTDKNINTSIIQDLSAFKTKVILADE